MFRVEDHLGNGKLGLSRFHVSDISMDFRSYSKQHMYVSESKQVL